MAKEKKEKKAKIFHIPRLQDKGNIPRVTEFVETGCLPLDVVLCGGWPVGRFSIMYGGSASGKSALAAAACASAQKQGWPAYYLDNEKAVDEEFFSSLGVSVKDLIYDAPVTLKHTFDGLTQKEADELNKDSPYNEEDDGYVEWTPVLGIKNFIEWKNSEYGPKTPAVVIWDSIASTTTGEEMLREGEDTGYPLFAKALSAELRKGVSSWAQSNLCFIAINQIRTKLGQTFGDTDALYGGKGVPFYSSVTLKLQYKGKTKKARAKGHVIVAENVVATCVKNRQGRRWRYTKLVTEFNDGINEFKSLLEMFKEFGLATIAIKNVTFTAAPLTGEVLTKDEIKQKLKSDNNFRDDIYDMLDEAFTP